MRSSPLGVGHTSFRQLYAHLASVERGLRPEVVVLPKGHGNADAIEFRTGDGAVIRLPLRRDVPNGYGFAPVIAWTFAWGKVTHVDTIQEYLDSLPAGQQ
jgi:hypothetical protein